MAAHATPDDSGTDAPQFPAYYEPVATPADADGDYRYFQPTGATVSVWSPDIQHGGPPTGLLVQAMEDAVDPRPVPERRENPEAPDGLAFTRVTMEILGAVGLGVNRVRTWVPRPGRQISQVAAELDAQQPDGSFRTVGRATAWRLRAGDTSAIADLPHPPLPTGPEEGPRTVGFHEVDGVSVPWGRIGFIGTVEVALAPGRNGHASAVWLRPLLPLIAGAQTGELASAFTVIDVANGVGTRLDPAEWSWMNTDTTVHLTGRPRGEWIGLDAALAAGGEGFGASFADLYDTGGFFGRSAQTVLLSKQS